MLRGAIKRPCHRLDLRMIGRHPDPHQPERHPQTLEQVHAEFGPFAHKQLRGGIKPSPA